MGGGARVLLFVLLLRCESAETSRRVYGTSTLADMAHVKELEEEAAERRRQKPKERGSEHYASLYFHDGIENEIENSLVLALHQSISRTELRLMRWRGEELKTEFQQKERRMWNKEHKE